VKCGWGGLRAGLIEWFGCVCVGGGAADRPCVGLFMDWEDGLRFWSVS
jgi:hypothetical protein